MGLFSGVKPLFEQLPLFGAVGRETKPGATGKERYVLIGARIVPYSLKLAARRRLAMAIDERGLTISAPLRTAIRDIEAFIAQHGQWVLKKIDEHAGRAGRRHLAMRDGACLPLLGGEIAVRVIKGANRIRWVDGELVLEARAHADCDVLARRALMRRAAALFAERAALHAHALGVAMPRLGLSSARTRWGSCSEKSGIRINWRLIHLPLALIDYVIIHELAHLIEMNHSPRFWAVVASLYPEWRAARRELKTRAQDIPII